jgi:hypothetical protein
MQFGFEKHVKTSEVKPVEIEKELTEEERQQKFQQECLIELDKLGTNLERVKADIDSFGGLEKFKEHFERITALGQAEYPGDGTMLFKNPTANLAGDTQRNLEQKIKHIGKDISLEVITTMTLALTVLLNMINKEGILQVDHIGVTDAIQAVKEGSADAIHYLQGISALFTTALLALVAKTKIGERFEIRRLNREKKINDLKFKMTGTEVK